MPNLVLFSSESPTRAKVTSINHVPFDPIDGCTPEELQAGVLVDDVLVPEQIEGKKPVHYINPTNGEQWYEYVNAPPPKLTLDEQALKGLRDQQTELLSHLGIAPPVAEPLTLEDHKKNKLHELKTAGNRAILAGFTSSVTGTPQHYNLDYEDQINLEALKNNIALGVMTEAEYYAAGEPCSVYTGAQIMQLYTEGMNFKVAKIRACKEYMAQVKDEAMDTVEKVVAFNVEAIVW